MEKMHEKINIEKEFESCKLREGNLPMPRITWKARIHHILQFTDDPSCISEHLHTT